MEWLILLAIGPALVALNLHRKVPVIVKPGLDARGRTNGFVIWVRDKSMTDTLEHEYEHVKQMWRLSIFGYGLLYRLYKPFRLWAESSAYAVSVNHGRPLSDAASALANNHGISHADAEHRIRIKMG